MSLFSNFKDTDKVWVYTAAQPLDAAAQEQIKASAAHFLDSWESHGAQVKGTVEVLYDRFVVVVADDCDGSMCGRAQDAQVRFAKELEQALGITLLDRMNLGYKNTNGTVDVVSMDAFRKEVAAGTITANTIVFNNMVADLASFHKAWEVPAKESWHQQLL